MAQLKVKKKDIIVVNTIVFLGLAILFLCLQHAYRHHLSPFSLTYLQKSAELFWWTAILVTVSSVMIWRHHPWARKSFMLSVFLIGFKVVEGLFIEFNKIIVIALFFYIVISYFLYQLLSYYLDRASVNPNYAASDLFPPMLKSIPCTVTSGDKTFCGFLTNWDEEGCFFKSDSAQNISGKVSVKIDFQRRTFDHKGDIVSQSLDFSGIGIKFNETEKDLKVFNWAEFMELVDELGFEPQRLR